MKHVFGILRGSPSRHPSAGCPLEDITNSSVCGVEDAEGPSFAHCILLSQKNHAMKADLPANETARLDALREYAILDTLPEASYDDITRLASDICEAPIALVSLVDRDRQWFKSKTGVDLSETPREVAFCAHAILEPDLFVVPDARDDSRFADNPLVINPPHVRFYAGAPLLTSRKEALGTLCVLDKVPRTLTERQKDLLRALSRQVMAQLELRRHIAQQHQYREMLEEIQRKLEETNEKLLIESVSDDVSGFYNTRFLHQYLDRFLQEAENRTRQLSLVFFDMDRFKRVVDTHGHLLGAAVLKEVAQAVNQHLDTEDRIVRYGGDEFVVILPEQGTDQALAKVVKMKERIASTSFLSEQGLDVRVTASFGLAAYPQDATDKKQLLTEADKCLFQSKKRGRNRITRKEKQG